MVTEPAAAARGLAPGPGDLLAVASALAAARVAEAVDVVLPSTAEQAGTTSNAAKPAIAPAALTVFRMGINLVRGTRVPAGARPQ
jgi:hypothetical protein